MTAAGAVPRAARLEATARGQLELLIPGGSEVHYYVRLGERATLAFQGAGEAPAAWISVWQRGLHGPGTLLYRGPAGHAETRVALEGKEGEVAKLVVKADGEKEAHLVRLALQEDSSRAPIVDRLPSRVERPNVVLYIVDTLRADHLSCYGYSHPTSPRLEAFAREAVLFEDAQAQASWTRPAVASLLTGLDPVHHGAVELSSVLSGSVPTMAELLKEQGYTTAAFVTNMNVSPRWGLRRGFDTYVYAREQQSRRTLYLPASALHEKVQRWLRRNKRRRFFLYVHASDPHAPYTPSEEFRGRFERGDSKAVAGNLARPFLALKRNPAQATQAQVEWLESLYDAEIAEFDQSLGDFVAWLRREGILERTLFVFSGDHGEEFHEHGGFSHGDSLFREQLQVPLLIRFPGGWNAGKRVKGVVQQVDVLPTILDYLAVPRPGEFDGKSLLPRLVFGVDGRWEMAVSHTSLGPKEIKAVTSRDWKVIFASGGGARRRKLKAVEVFDRRHDRGEDSDESLERPDLVAYARQVLALVSRGHLQIAAVNERLEPEVRRRLEALGYVGR